MKHLIISTFFILLTTPHNALAETQLLFGDTHLHTSYSFDAYLNKNQSADPDTAYRWAKGQAVVHALNRTRAQIDTPLDFLVVSDHAELMGVIRALNRDEAETEDLGLWGNLKRWFAVKTLNDAIEGGEGSELFNSLLPVAPTNPDGDPVLDSSNNIDRVNPFGDTVPIETSAWHEIVDAAERHNNPGTFTSFVGWEWSSIPTGANLHRIVFSPDGADKAKQYLPYGSDDSQYPEDLWQWLEVTQKKTGSRFLAMPHNSNISKGYMYADTTLKGDALDSEYARQRMQWEPVSEVTQIKGDSETHPTLSPEDEFADFETYEYYIQQTAEAYTPRAADYARSALRLGLAQGQSLGVNPYQFGMIGSTDSHSGLSSPEEHNFWGKFARDSTPETKRGAESIGNRGVTGWDMSASGLAAVWAEENTRESIFAAFQRKEVYATTGTRLKVRVFGGWNFSEESLQSADFANLGYQYGVPMGAELTGKTRPDDAAAPQMLIKAFKDPKGAHLDRVQVIKGWVDADGATFERVYNVAWAGNRTLDDTGKLSAIGNTVDLSSGQVDNSIGADSLSVLWSDPDFNATQSAFYYIRVLQIPTARHSLYDGIALQMEDAPEEGPATIQERAYTSPIWYTP
ncbi:MAG: DUF3604 domain-containing protein [Pseudomonadales bacterium]